MLIQQIKHDQLAARKAGDKVKAKSLTLVISDSSGAGTEAREPSDSDVIKVIRKHLKSLNETKTLLGDVTESNKERCIVNGEEILILEQYLPQSFSDEEIEDLMKVDGMTIGQFMGIVKQAAAEGKLFDGAQVQRVLKSVLTK